MSTVLFGPELEEARATSVSPRSHMPNAARGFFDLLVKSYGALQRIFKVQRVQKQLRVCETVSLGEKRFVALIQVDQERFLIGGSANSIAMLSRLAEVPSFSSTMQGFTEAGAVEK